MNVIRKNLGYALFIAFCVLFAVYFIYDLTQISDALNVEGSNLPMILLIIDILACLIMISISAYGILRTNKEDERKILICCVFLGMVYSFSNALGTIVTMAEMQKIYDSAGIQVNWPSETIMVLIFLIFGFVALLFGAILNYENNLKTKKGFAVTGLSCIFIALIITLANSDSSQTTFQVIMSIFQIILMICLGAYVLFINCFNNNIDEKIKICSFCGSEVQSDKLYCDKCGHKMEAVPTTVKSKNNNYSNKQKISTSKLDQEEAEDSLRRLKQMLDEKIITEEEYNEKRKKYIDRL